MPLKIQTLGNTSLRRFTEILMPPCVLLLMSIGWSAICNHNCNFPEVVFPFCINFEFPFIFGFVVGGVYTSFP